MRRGSSSARWKEKPPSKTQMEGGEVTRRGAGTSVRCGHLFIGKSGKSLREKFTISKANRGWRSLAKRACAATKSNSNRETRQIRERERNHSAGFGPQPQRIDARERSADNVDFPSYRRNPWSN